MQSYATETNDIGATLIRTVGRKTIQVLLRNFRPVFRCVYTIAESDYSSVMSVCPSARPSIRMEQLGFHWAVFHEI